MKSAQVGESKFLYQGSPSDSHNEFIAEKCDGVKVSGQEDAVSPHMQLLNRLANQRLDEKSLDALKSRNHQTVLRCIHLCWAWCHKEIRDGESQISHPFAPAGIDGIDDQYAWDTGRFVDLLHSYIESGEIQQHPEWAGDQYAWDARLFVYLLRRYIRSGMIQEYPEWAGMAKTTIMFCPINMLFAMSSFIVSVANNAFKDLGTFMLLLAPDTELEMAELGAKGMGLLERDKLMEEFCDELEENFKDFAGYAAAFRSAVDMLGVRNEPETRIINYPGVAGQGFYQSLGPEDWDENVGEGIIFPVEGMYN